MAGNISFYDGTEKLLTENRCPACVTGQMDKRYFYVWFNIENYHSPPTMMDFSENGLCPEHGWELANLGQKLSTINHFIISNRMVDLEKIKTALQRSYRSVWLEKFRLLKGLLARHNKNAAKQAIRKLHPDHKCPVCKTVLEGEKRAVLYASQFLSTERGQTLYRDHSSFCWRHFIDLLEMVPTDLALTLVDMQSEYLLKIDRDLDEFSRKQDYRFSHEPKGEEQLAWLRSLRYYVGEKPEKPFGNKKDGLAGAVRIDNF